MPHLEAIYVYPIKSLDGTAVETATITPSGSLDNDRRYAMVDTDGEYINGKRTPAVHRIRAEFGPGCEILTLDDGERSTRFDLTADEDRVAAWLDGYLDPSVSLVRDDALGHPDDTDDAGPTVISTGTLEELAGWYPSIDDPAEMRRRLRPNLVVEAEPFWEDRLYGGPGEAVTFDIGNVSFEGTSPCQRCVVPTRDPDTGQEVENFRETFVENREATLPSWADERQFDHFFKVMVNTRTPEASSGETLAVGDEVVIGETVGE